MQNTPIGLPVVTLTFPEIVYTLCDTLLPRVPESVRSRPILS